MKIEMKTTTTCFEDLAAGDVFEFEGNVYMKIVFSQHYGYPYANASGCVRLSDGLLMLTYPTEDLKKLDGAYVVPWGQKEC